jgi:two-component system NtrC family sensor kinase
MHERLSSGDSNPLPSARAITRTSELRAAETVLSTLRRASGEALIVSDEDPLVSVVDYFERDSHRPGVLIRRGRGEFGMISRAWIDATLSRPNARDLFLRKPISMVLRFCPMDVLELLETATIPLAIESALSRRPSERYEPIMVLDKNGSRWLLTVNTLLTQQCHILSATLMELEAQRQATEAAEVGRRELQRRLLTASRDAGRAEIATGILHDVGNVLNSVNVSVSMINKTLQQSKLPNLGRSIQMIEEHRSSLGEFLTSDERGQRLPGYLAKLADTLGGEQKQLHEEVAALQKSLEHVGHVVKMQQSYAKGSTLRELVNPSELLDDALQMNLVSFERHNIRVAREYTAVGPRMLDKHKVLQILVNLVSNAKDAMKGNDTGHRHLAVKIEECNAERLRFSVSDNGAGITSENLTRIFTHGFTTRKEGHGFGLHGSANAAKEMNGTLIGTSEGPGNGATFILEVPTASLTETAAKEASVPNTGTRAAA